MKISDLASIDTINPAADLLMLQSASADAGRKVTVDQILALIPDGSQSVQTMYIDAQRRTNFTFPSAPATFVWDVEVSDTYQSYNPTTGVITMPFSGQYTFAFMFNAAATTGTDYLYAYVEVSSNGGASWQTATYSGRRIAVVNGQDSQVFMVSNNYFTVGQQLRFVFFSSDTTTTASNFAIPSSSAIVPAARLLITGVGGAPT
jgi:hypothetical protein